MNNEPNNKATASDYGLSAGMPIVPDSMVAMAEYVSKLIVENAQHFVATGERIPAVTIYLRIADELGMSEESVRFHTHAGRSIIWDRELRDLSDEEKEQALLLYTDPEALIATLTPEELELAEELDGFIAKSIDELCQGQDELNLLNELWEQ